MDPSQPISQPGSQEPVPPQPVTPIIQPTVQPSLPPQPEVPTPAPQPAAPSAPVVDSTPAPNFGAVVSGDFSNPTSMPQPAPPGSTWHGVATLNQPQPTPAQPQPAVTQPGATPFGAVAPTGPQVSPMPQPTVGAMGAGAAMAPPKKKLFKSKAFMGTIGVVLLLGFGSAAAYFGVIVPNQPANVLKQAVVNTLEQTQYSFNGNASVSSNSSSSGDVAGNLSLNGSLDTANKTSDLDLDVTISGVSVNLETRYVGQNLYLRLGDLSTLSSLLSTLDSGDAPVFNKVSSQLSNQWVEVDSTLLKEAGLSCIMNGNDSITNADINLLSSAYAKNQFVNIVSTSSGNVNGQAAEKYVVNISDNSLDQYIDSLSTSNLAKSYESCGSSSSKPVDLHGDGQSVPMTIWVNKATKRLTQIDWQPSTKLVKSSGYNGSLTMNLGYNPAAVTAPANSESALSVVTQLDQDFGQSSSSSGSSGLNLDNLFNSFDSASSSTNTILQ